MTRVPNPARGRFRLVRPHQHRSAPGARPTGQRNQRRGQREPITADRSVLPVTEAAAGGHVLLSHLMRQTTHPAGDRDRGQPISHEHHHAHASNRPGYLITGPRATPGRPFACACAVARRDRSNGRRHFHAWPLRTPRGVVGTATSRRVGSRRLAFHRSIRSRPLMLTLSLVMLGSLGPCASEQQSTLLAGGELAHGLHSRLSGHVVE
jgi:hypothetical protein